MSGRTLRADENAILIVDSYGGWASVHRMVYPVK